MAEKLRIGVLGCARITEAALLDAARQVAGVEVLAVASREEARALAYAARFGIARAYGDYASLITQPDIDVIYNPLPNALHAQWTIRALEAGKAVLCEKPLASNAAEAERMGAAARRTGRPLIEAFHYRYHPMMRHIVEQVRRGALGAVRRIEATLRIPGRLLQPDDVRFDLALAGGAAMDLGCYGVNALRLVAGEEPAITAASAQEARPDVDGAMRADFSFPGGAVGRVDCSLVADALTSRLVIAGERATLVAENPFLPQLGNSVSMTLGAGTETTRFERTPTYVFQLRALVETLRNGAPSLTPGEDGLANMRAIDAIYDAAGLPRRG